MGSCKRFSHRQMATVCSKLCTLKDKDINNFIHCFNKGTRDAYKGTKWIKQRKRGVMDMDTKQMIPH